MHVQRVIAVFRSVALIFAVITHKHRKNLQKIASHMTNPRANHDIIGPIRHISTLKRHCLAQFFTLIPIL